MENGIRILMVWVHILGVALWVGPQFFLAFAWVPASRGIADLSTRVAAMRVITRRFGYIGGVGLGLILVAGTYLIATWRDYWGVGDEVGFLDLRYGWVFTVKMLLLAVMLVLVGFHMFVIGPRQIAILEEQAKRGAPDQERERELARLRRLSMMLSAITLLVTLAIMMLGVTLSVGEYSLQEM